MSFLHIRSEPSRHKTGVNTKTGNPGEPFSSRLEARAHPGALASPRGRATVCPVLTPLGSVAGETGRQRLIRTACLDSRTTSMSRRTRTDKNRTVIGQI